MRKRNWLLALGTASVLIVTGLIFMFSFITPNTAESQGTAEETQDEEQKAQEQTNKQKENQTAKNDVPAEETKTPEKTKNTTTEEPKPEQPEPEPDSSFTIAFAGDTMFDWDLRPILNEKGYDYPFEYVKQDLQPADYTVVNLETAITKRTKKTDSQLYWIRSEEAGLSALKNSGVDMVNLANNHVLDYGKAGLLDTIQAVERNQLAHIGAGKNEQEAYQAKVVEINNQSVAFLSFSRFYPESDWAAVGDRTGVTNGYNLNNLINKINEQQEQLNADYTIVNFHWGVEKTNTPAPYQREYVKRIVEETDTDAIVGSHPHWLQGFEFYQDVPVAYSLGNFLFPGYVSGHTAETGVYNLTFDNGEVSADFVPYEIKDNQIQPLKGNAEQTIYKYLDDISINARLDEKGNISKEN